MVFTGSNFGDGDSVPYEPFANYVDGAWYFTADPSVVNSFKTRYDDVWTDTTLYGNYANISGAHSQVSEPSDRSVGKLSAQSESCRRLRRTTIALIDSETRRSI